MRSVRQGTDLSRKPSKIKEYKHSEAGEVC